MHCIPAALIYAFVQKEPNREMKCAKRMTFEECEKLPLRKCSNRFAV